MKTIQIVIDNLKCGGCAGAITKELKHLPGITSVEVNNQEDRVTIETSDDFKKETALEKLLSLGYPEKGSVHGLQKLTAGAKSFVSCAIGRIDNLKTEQS